MGAAANLSPALLARAIGESRDGIIVADAQKPGFPLVYANLGFEELTGYAVGEAVGKSWHFLLGSDTDQPETNAIHAALAASQSCIVTLRNYRKDGSMFWNETSISPVPSVGAATHFIGIQRDVTDRISLEQRLTTVDPLAGVSNRRHFEQRFSDCLVFTRRAHSGMSLLKIDVDYFDKYVESRGQAAGEECLRRVGECIAGLFVRTSDCVARLDDCEFSVVSLSFGANALRRHAQKLNEQVRALGMPHADSPHGVVTVSIGGVHCMPVRETSEEMLVGVARAKLHIVKRNGGNGVLIIG